MPFLPPNQQRQSTEGTPDREEPTINHILTSLATLLLSTASNQRIHRPDLLPQVVENKSVSAKNTGICFKAKKTHNA